MYKCKGGADNIYNLTVMNELHLLNCQADFHQELTIQPSVNHKWLQGFVGKP